MKKNNFVKIILIIFAIALVVAIAAMLMPVAFVGGLGAVWYFTKRNLIVINATSLSLLL